MRLLSLSYHKRQNVPQGRRIMIDFAIVGGKRATAHRQPEGPDRRGKRRVAGSVPPPVGVAGRAQAGQRVEQQWLLILNDHWNETNKTLASETARLQSLYLPSTSR